MQESDAKIPPFSWLPQWAMTLCLGQEVCLQVSHWPITCPIPPLHTRLAADHLISDLQQRILGSYSEYFLHFLHLSCI